MPIHHFGLPPLLSRFSNVSRLYSSALALKQIGHSAFGRTQAVPADGDRLQLEYFLDGTETLFEISTNMISGAAKWDLYVNSVLDSSGYDDYDGAGAVASREITLANPVRYGHNRVELRVNGKNALSSGYTVQVYGASIQ